MTPDQKNFLQRAFLAACKAAHIFPGMAACEAALESGYGRSVLAIQDKNLFGMKQHRHAIYGTHTLPTREFEDGEWIERTANFVSYPDWASCFSDRMSTLSRLAPYLEHYRNALSAETPDVYVAEVSKTWSTDPQRGAKVQSIYDEMVGQWDAGS